MAWMRSVLAGCLLVTVGFGTLYGPVLAQNVNDSRFVLRKNWEEYRHNFIQKDGRVIDHRSGLSTSEGQSYAMLRAVWMRDREWFDKSYQWAVDNLQKRDDKLFAWKWGQKQDGAWGVLDETAATDADQDIALALLLAHEIWKEPRYKQDALDILDSLWDKLTIATPLGRVLLPGDWQAQKGRDKSVQINPSYFAPYAYRVFDEADNRHPWKQLVKSSYQIWKSAIKQSKTGLPPDWAMLSLQDGSVKLYSEALDTRSDYGNEAIRVFWRAGMDYLIQPPDKQSALEILESGSAAHYLPRAWKIKGELPGLVTWDGIARKEKPETAAVYGATLIGLLHQNPEAAREVMTQKVIPHLKPGSSWHEEYYSQNWLWMGLAAYVVDQQGMAYPRNLSYTERLTWVMNLAP